MVPLQKLFAVALSSTFLLAKISGDGSIESYSTNASVDLTKEIENSSISLVKYIEIFTPDETFSGNDRRLGFPCNSETCLSLCCSSREAYLNGICVEDYNTSGILPQIDISGDNMHLFTADPCDVNWLLSSELQDFRVFRNGTIYIQNFAHGSHFDFEHHCLFRRPNSTEYIAKVCYPWLRIEYWQMSSLVIVIVIMLVIFVGYSVTPELRNLHGMVFRAYLITYIATHLAILGQLFTADSRTYAYLFTFFVFFLHYSAGCCALWFNVMCYDIWRTFRGLRPIDEKIRDHERKKFISYAIYAWVSPAILHTITILVTSYVPYFRHSKLNNNPMLWCCVILLTSVIVCNTIFYSLTSLRIRKHRKDTADLTNGVKHHETVDQWFSLHMKLFVITGCHTIMWVIWELWPTFTNTIVMTILEVVQCILLFVLFTWKDNVKRSVRERYDNTMCRLQSTFGTSHATSSNPC